MQIIGADESDFIDRELARLHIVALIKSERFYLFPYLFTIASNIYDSTAQWNAYSWMQSVNYDGTKIRRTKTQKTKQTKWKKKKLQWITTKLVFVGAFFFFSFCIQFCLFNVIFNRFWFKSYRVIVSFWIVGI